MIIFRKNIVLTLCVLALSVTALRADVIEKNYKNSLALLDTATGYLTGCMDKIRGIREQAVRAANGIYTPQDRITMDKQVQAGLDDARRQLQYGLFNGMEIFQKETGKKHSLNTVHFKTGPFSGFSHTFPEGRTLLAAESLRIRTSVEAISTIGTVDGILMRIAGAQAGIAGARERLRYETDFSRQLTWNIMNGKSVNLQAAFRKSLREVRCRMFALALESANGIYSPFDRSCLDMSFQQLIAAHDSIVDSMAQYGKKNAGSSASGQKPEKLAAMDIRTVEHANSAVSITLKGLVGKP